MTTPNPHVIDEDDSPTADRARLIVDQDRQERAGQCAADIDTALRRHRCQLTCRPVLTDDGRLSAVVQIVAL